MKLFRTKFLTTRIDQAEPQPEAQTYHEPQAHHGTLAAENSLSMAESAEEDSHGEEHVHPDPNEYRRCAKMLKHLREQFEFRST